VYKAHRSIVLSDVYFYVREHKVAYIPAVVIPIPRNKRLPENENSDLQQSYGYSYLDGFFAKFAYTYYQHYADPAKLNGPLLGVAKLDLSQKRGPGGGIRQDFYNPNLGVTHITAYYQEDWEGKAVKDSSGHPTGERLAPERNLQFEFSQELNLSKALQGNAKVTRNDVITPSGNSIQGGRRTQRTNNWDNTFDLAYVKGDTNVRLNGTQHIDITGGQPNGTGDQLRRVNQNTNVTLTADQQISDEVRLNASEVYTATKGLQAVSGVPADQEGVLTASLNFAPKPDSPLEGYTAQARIQQQTDLDGDKNRTSQDQNRAVREEYPSIQIGLPRDLLGDGAFFNSFQINLDNLVTGTRRRPESAFRAKFAANGNETTRYGSGSVLTTRLGLAQYLYDDGNAQYTIAPNVGYTYDSFNGWKFGANYDLQFQQGVRNPPVQGDAVRYRQSFQYNAELTNYRSWRWRLSSGFDLAHQLYAPTPDPNDVRDWTPSPLSSTFTWDPNDTASFAHNISYNLLTKSWGPTRLGLTLRSPYIDERGYYNWFLGIGIDANTDYFNPSFASTRNETTKRNKGLTLLHFEVTSVDVDWFKKYERGWSSEVLASYRPRSGNNLDSQEPLTGFDDQNWEDMIRLIRLRKENCCTTLEFGWRVGIDEYYVNAYLNALPQYPATFTRGHTTEGVFYDMAFPSDALFNDVQQELFPGSQIPNVGGFL
jgi:hypothetical protein